MSERKRMKSTGMPTKFRGIEYRSRLEARWAAMFDQLGWEYEYEPFDGNGYIPDFLVHNGNLISDRPLLVEVKPAVTDDDYREPWTKISNGLLGHWTGDILLVGTSPLPASMWQSEFFNTVAGTMAYYRGGFCDDCCGAYFREHGQSSVIFDDPLKVPPCSHWTWWWSGHNAAHWVVDPKGTMGLVGMDVAGCPAAMNVDTNYWQELSAKDRTRRDVEQCWINATNEVKWRGR